MSKNLYPPTKIMETNAIRIVLLETAQFSVEGIKNFYSGIFQHLGYETTFKEISSDKSNYEGNKSVFRNEVVDLFIIDLSLGFLDSNDYAGLEIIATLKRRQRSGFHRDLSTILEIAILGGRQ